MSRRIFISAVSKELQSYRKVVSESLLKRGYTPVYLDTFNHTVKEIGQTIKEALAACDAVICLIGHCYGFEPSQAVDGFPRRSLTQLEYFWARATTEPRPKHISLFLTTDQTPVDQPNDEPEELRELQRTYRAEVTRDRNWRQFSNATELRAEIAELCFPWEQSVPSEPFLFASYSMKDRAVAVPFIEKLQQLGTNIFFDLDLQPGMNWERSLLNALSQAAGLLVFVSPQSMASDWVRKEIEMSEEASGRLIIPVILEHPQDMPNVLKSVQWVDLTGSKTSAQMDEAAQRVSQSFRQFRSTFLPTASDASPQARLVAKEIASDLRRSQQRPEPKSSPPRSVFVAHGHDLSLLDEVRTYVTQLGIEPVVLSRIAGASQSLFQKFIQFGQETGFAIVLLTADDFGASRLQYEAEGVGERALQFRPRQNVVLELGFFYGRLGWEQVFVLQKKPHKVFPNFEKPSDLEGVLFDLVDEEGSWKQLLRVRLDAAGFDLKADEETRAEAKPTK